MHFYLNRYWPHLLLITIGIVLYKGILQTYAFTDAYDFAYSANKTDFISVFLQGGRPFYGLAMKWSYSWIQTIDDLSYLRLMSLLFSMGTCFIFYAYLKKIGYKKVESTFLAIVLLVSPSLSIKIVWSVLWIMPFVLMLSFLSGVLLLSYVKTKKLSDLLLSILLGVIVLLTYQPIFTFSLMPLLLHWLNKKSTKVIIKYTLFHLSYYVFYFAIFKGYIYLLDITPLNRTSITFDIIQQLKWFFTGPFIKSFTWNFFFVSSGFRWAMRGVLLSTLIISVFYSSQKGIRSAILALFIILLSMLAAYIPNLLSSDNWMSYRTMDALILIPIVVLWHNLSKSTAKKSWKYGFFISFLVVSIFMSSKNINAGFIDLQVTELTAVKQKIERSDGVETWNFVQAPLKTVKDHKILKRVITDEFGRLSSSSDWVPRPMVKLLLRSLDKSEDVEVRIVAKGDNVKDGEIINVETLFLNQLDKNLNE